MNAKTAFIMTLKKSNNYLAEVYEEIEKAISKGKYNTTAYIYNISYDDLNEIVNILEKQKYKASYEYNQFDTSFIYIDWNFH